MELEKLATLIKGERESNNFSLQAVFNRHIEAITLLKENGIPFKRMNEVLTPDINLVHFYNLIRRAKKTEFKAAVKKQHHAPEIRAKEQPPSPVEKGSEKTLLIDDEDSLIQHWYEITGRELKPEIINRFIDHGIDADSFKNLNLNNVNQIFKHLTLLDTQSKYKKLKDDK